MDIRKVKKLIELLEESGVAEIEIHEGEESVRISRQAAGAQVYPTMAMMPQAAPAPAPAPATPVAEPVPIESCLSALIPGVLLKIKIKRIDRKVLQDLIRVFMAYPPFKLEKG